MPKKFIKYIGIKIIIKNPSKTRFSFLLNSCLFFVKKSLIAKKKKLTENEKTLNQIHKFIDKWKDITLKRSSLSGRHFGKERKLSKQKLMKVKRNSIA